MNSTQTSSPPVRRASFGEDFRRFFVRGLAAVMPTLITLWLLVKVWEFLWEALGRHLVTAIRLFWLNVSGLKIAVGHTIVPFQTPNVYPSGRCPANSVRRAAFWAFAWRFCWFTWSACSSVISIGRAFKRLGEMANDARPPGSCARSIRLLSRLRIYSWPTAPGSLPAAGWSRCSTEPRSFWTIGLVTGPPQLLADATGGEVDSGQRVRSVDANGF